MNSLVSRVLNKLAYSLPGGFSLRPGMQRWRGAHIGKGVWISQYVYFDVLHPEGIFIGDNVTVGIRSSIITHFYWGPRRKQAGFKEVHLERDVFIGPHCLILPGVKVGEGAVIKGGSVLTRDVPPHTFWGPPSSGPIAAATVPLTPAHSYEDFVKGLKPWRRGKK